MSDTLRAPARSDDPSSDPSPAAGPARPPTRRATAIHLAVVGLLALVLAVVIFRPWPLDDPVIYSNDTFQHLAILQATDGVGSPGASPSLGAPGAVDWSVFPTGTERLQLVEMQVLLAVTGSAITAMNLYLLLAVTATAVVSFAVLRWMGLRPVLAGAVGIVVAFGPAVASAVVGGHLFLVSLVPVALGTYLALWATMTDPTQLRHRGGRLAPAAAVLVVALSSAYFTAFSLVLISVMGVAVALRARSLRRLVLPLATVLLTGAVAALSLLPDLIRRAGDPAASALRRTAADVRRYSLRPQDLFSLDQDHPLHHLTDALRDLGPSGARPVTGTMVGVVALLGCAVVVTVAVRHGREPRDRDDRVNSRLAVVVVTALAMAVTGGVGTVLGDLGVTQIRAWSRMVVFLGFAALAGLALAAQRAASRHRWSPGRVTAAVVAVAVLALLDQGLVRTDPGAADAVASDRALVADLTSALGPDAAVFEVPVVSFPDDPGSGRLLAPAVLSDGSLKFSAGFFRGGEDDWQLSWCRRPSAQFVRAVTAVGFDALLVQRNHHLIDDVDDLEAQLLATLGPPTGVSEDGAFAWYDLRPLHAELVAEHGAAAVERAGGIVTRPIGVDYEGVTDLRKVGRVMADGGDVVLRRLDDDTSPVQLTLQVASDGGDPVPEVDDVDMAGSDVSVPIEGDAPVTVSGVSVIDRRALDDPVLGPAEGPALPAVCM